jgi:hypothetical protein
LSRLRKVQKQDTWIRKSNAKCSEDMEMPQVLGLDKLKILGSVITKKLVKRLVTGEVIVTDIETYKNHKEKVEI